MSTQQQLLLRDSLSTINKLSKQLSTIKDMLPIDHPAQNMAAYDVEEICAELERMLARLEGGR